MTASMLQAAGDRAHSRSRAYRRRLADARRIISDAPAGAVASVSWGKDSVAMLSVVVEERPEMPVVHYRHPPCERPDQLDAVRDACLDRWGLAGRYIEVPFLGWTEAWRRVGRCWLEPRDDEERAADRAVKAENRRRMRAALAQIEATACLVGVRGGESRRRLLAMASRGREWTSSDYGLATIAPVGWWTAQDVWARHAECDLPSAALYHAPGVDRDRARSELVFQGAPAVWAHGEAAVWRRAVPDAWRLLADEFPEVEQWT